jgi:hypothetical protein
MQFSNTSQEYFNFFIEHFNKCIIKNKESEQKIQNKIFNKLFLDIREADKYVKTLNAFDNCLSGIVLDIKSKKGLALPSTYSNDHFPQEIRKVIETKTVNKILYYCVLNERKITLTFFTFKNETNFAIYDKYAKQVFMLIAILTHYSSSECSKSLNIFIYLTDFKRIIPDNNYTILGSYNVNGGFTTTCDKNSEIVVYRKEEWFKVLIHEAFHNLGLDFSKMNTNQFHSKIKQIFPINSKFNIFESYCEFWARILNSAFCSYNVIDNKNDKDAFKTFLDFFIQIERLFSLFQCNKILKFLGISYQNLYETDNGSHIARENLYKETTNVFAYYIVTAFLLDNYVNVMNWCNKNNLSCFKFNNSQRNLDLFYNLIENSYKRNEFLKNLMCVSNYASKLNKKTNKNNKLANNQINNIFKTTRMTIMEFQ